MKESEKLHYWVMSEQHPYKTVYRCVHCGQVWVERYPVGACRPSSGCRPQTDYRENYQ